MNSKLNIVKITASKYKLLGVSYSKAAENFEAFPRSVKRGILEWILNAKKSETRQKRITETAALAQENTRANQYKK